MDKIEARARELLKSATTHRRERVIKDQNAVVYREDAIAAIASALSQQPEATAFRNDGNSEADFIAHEANACTSCGGSGHRDDQKPEARGVVDECTWSQQDIGSDDVSTSCGHEFMLNDLTDYPDGTRALPFCCYCAKPLVLRHWHDEDPLTEARNVR